MKKYITSFLMAAMVAVMIPFMSTSADAQTRRNLRSSSSRTYSRSTYDRGNVYDRHRNLINVGIGTAAGAILGGIFGGKKGALIGTAAGAGGAALYTYKLNPKTKKYYRVYNNRRY
jgi:outer membrane lipoprotein SlyB